MNEIKIEFSDDVCNPVFRPYLDCMARTQIYYGGASSGKSVFLAQRAVQDVLSGGRNYLICRQVGRTLRGSVSQEINKVIKDWKVASLFDINKTDGTITCHNGYQIIFVGLDDVEKLKSITPAKGVITDIWVEESTETDEKTITQLYKRQRGGDKSIPKRLMLSFNPIFRNHWIYKKYFDPIKWREDQTEYKSDDLSILKTTYKNNEFLTDGDIKDLENEQDTYFYDVYTLGKWGVLGNVIFKNWRVEDLSAKHAQFTNHRNGLDFGFSSNPAGVVVTHYDTAYKTIYIFDELYQCGLKNTELAEEVVKLIGTSLVVCDSAEPKSIMELKDLGVTARPARKGKDSVTFGIQWLQGQTIIVDSKCVGMQNELTQYKWKEDASGQSLPVPVDRNNHLIDSLRYAYEDDMERKTQQKARSWKR